MGVGASVLPTAAIIGCGRIAGSYNDQDDREPLTHVVAYRQAGVRVVGCCDRDADRAARFAARWDVPVWQTDTEALLGRVTPDIVSICTPPEGRVAIVEAVCRSVVRALVIEKPLAGTARDAGRIVERLRAWGRPVIVNYQRAFDPWYLALEDEVRGGAVGAVREIVARYYGAASTNASHLLERVRAMCGSPAGARRLSDAGPSPMFQLTWADAMCATFLPTRPCAWAPLELDILGERGRIRVIDGEQRVERYGAIPDPHYPGFGRLVPLAPGDGPKGGALTRVIEAGLRGAGGGVPNGDLLLRAAEVTTILESVET